MYLTSEAAKKTGLSEQRIQQYCRKHSVKKIGRQYFLTDEDIKIIQILKRKKG